MSSDIRLKIQIISDVKCLPSRSNPTDSGLDLRAFRFEKIYAGDTVFDIDPSIEEISLQSGYRALINTGIKATVGPGYEIQIRPRSGLALKQGLTVLNTPGTVDESYRGDLCVILTNTSGTSQKIKKYDRISQMVVCPVILCDVEVVDSLPETDRGDGGFGSTGVQ